MTNRIRAFWRGAAALALVCAFSQAARASPFLSAEIEAALSARAGVLQRADLAEGDFLALPKWLESEDGQRFAGRLDGMSGVLGNDPWYNYLRGMASGDDGRAEGYYGRALSAAEADPGALWLLGLEFIRYGRFPWAAACFEAIEKNVFATGGLSAPFLSQQLMLFGGGAATGPKQAAFCYNWAKRFDAGQCWWLYRKGAIDFPDNVVSTAPLFIEEAVSVVITSWRAQLALLCGAYRFCGTALFIFSCAVILIFAVKYLPSGVHPLGDTLFRGASPRFRVISSVVIVLSTLFIGFVPAMWVIAFAVCRFLSAGEKKLLVAVCVILAVSPLDIYAAKFLRRHIEPSAPAALLDRAVHEGYSEGLYNLAAESARRRPANGAAQLALAVSATKGNNYKAGADAVERALRIAPDDQVALMYAGNIAFLEGDIDRTERFYGSILKKAPRYAEAKFNLAQAYVSRSSFTSTDMISEAAKIDPELIGGYMRANEQYFAGSPPPLRRIMQPALSPAYFWSRLFLSDPGEILEAGGAQSKFSPAAAFGVSAALLIILLIVDSVQRKDMKKARKYFTCRVCGRLLCRKCRKGTMCSDCYRECLDSQNNAAAMYNLQKRYQDRAQLRRDVTQCALGALVPGAGGLYKDEAVFRPAMAILFSSLIFAAAYCMLTFHTTYPSRAVFNLIYLVPVLLIYNLAAIAKQCLRLAGIFKARAQCL